MTGFDLLLVCSFGLAVLVGSAAYYYHYIVPRLRLNYFAYAEKVEIQFVRMYLDAWVIYVVFHRPGSTLTAAELNSLIGKLGLNMTSLEEAQHFLDWDMCQGHLRVCPYYLSDEGGALRYAARTIDGEYIEDEAPGQARWSGNTRYVAVFR